MKRIPAVLATAMALLAFAFALRLYAIAEPQTAIGYSLFRLSYDSAPNKSTVLNGFAANLEKYNGYYIPEDADRFLCARLTNPTSEAEFAAIADFYVDKAYGRAGQFVYLLPAPTKARITDLTLNRIDSYSTDKAELALTLLESLRQGKNLGKARFIDSGEQTVAEYSDWKQNTALPIAKKRFRNWNETYPKWPQKERHNPLENLDFEISDP